MSERYLEQLDLELRRQRVSARRRRRFLSEAEDHLLADPGAVHRFGDPATLAAQVAATERPARARWLALVLLGTIVALAAPLYAIPENTLPPAPAQGLPASVGWKLDAALALYGAALVLAVLAVVLSWVRPHLAQWPAWPAFGTLATSAVLGSVAAAQWPVGGSTAIASVVPFAGVLVCLAAFATARLASAAWHRPST